MIIIKGGAVPSEKFQRNKQRNGWHSKLMAILRLERQTTDEAEDNGKFCFILSHNSPLYLKRGKWSKNYQLWEKVCRIVGITVVT